MDVSIKILIVNLLLSWTAFSQAQEEAPQKYRWALGVAHISNQINIPFTSRVSTKRHHGLALNVQLEKCEYRRVQMRHVLALGYQNHSNLLDALWLQYTSVFAVEIKKTISLDLPIGLGYAQSFPKGQGYRLQDGEYIAQERIGKSHLRPTVGLGLSVFLEKLWKWPLILYGKIEVSAFVPYAPQSGLPFLPFTNIQSGIKYHF